MPQTVRTLLSPVSSLPPTDKQQQIVTHTVTQYTNKVTHTVTLADTHLKVLIKIVDGDGDIFTTMLEDGSHDPLEY